MAVVELRILSNGRLAARRLVKSSGHASMNATVLNACNAVAAIPGLSSEFILKHETITVSFKVD